MATALRAGDKGVAGGQALSGQAAAVTVAQTPDASMRKSKTGEAGGDEPAGMGKADSLVEGALLAMAMPAQVAPPVPSVRLTTDGSGKVESATVSVAYMHASQAVPSQHAAGGGVEVAAMPAAKTTAATALDNAKADGAMGVAGVSTQDAASAATAGADATGSIEDGKPGVPGASGGAALQKALIHQTGASGNGLSFAPVAVQVPGVSGALPLQHVQMGGAGTAVGAVAGAVGGARSTRVGAAHGLDLDASTSGLQAAGQMRADAGVVGAAGGLGGGAADGPGPGANTEAGSAAGGNSAGAGEDARAFSTMANAGDVASATPMIGTSRLLQTMSGTEMRVGLHSQEFGSISIATSLSAGSIATQILLEHAALGHALTAHLPAIAEKLESALGVSAKVEVRDSSVGAQVQQDSSGTSQGSAGAGGQGQAASQAAGRMAGVGRVAGSNGPSQPAAMGHAMQGGTGRLSIQA
jgi:hypothetical protein